MSCISSWFGDVIMFRINSDFTSYTDTDADSSSERAQIDCITPFR